MAAGRPVPCASSRMTEMPILIAGFVVAGIAWLMLTRQSPLVQAENQKAADEMARLAGLSAWNKIQPTGFNDKEKFFLSSVQAFYDAWYGVKITSKNLKDFVVAADDVWWRSGSGLRPIIAGLKLEWQPRILSVGSAPTFNPLSLPPELVVSKSVEIRKWRYIPAKYFARFNIEAAKTKAAGGLDWSLYLMTDQANEPDWTESSNGRSELTQDQAVSMLTQIVATAWSGGA